MNRPLWKIGLSLCICYTLLATGCRDVRSFHVESPDKNLQMVVQINQTPDPPLSLDILYSEQIIIIKSPLGLILKDGFLPSKIARPIRAARKQIAETYTMPHGKSSTIENNCNELVLTCYDSAGRQLDLCLRAYNDGAAFRYLIPRQTEIKDVEITGEQTAFQFTHDPTYWGLHLDSYRTPYEKLYTVNRISTIPDTAIIGMPVLLQIYPDLWLGLTEANLTDYAGMYLTHRDPDPFRLTTALSPLPDSSGSCVHTTTPCKTPWRVLMLGRHPGRLIESNIILNLNESCSFDVSWVKPGLAINDWMSDHTGPHGQKGDVDNATLMHYIDFCAEYGLEYMSIDAGWYGKDWWNPDLDITKPIPEVDIPMLVRYANAKNVDVFLWTYGPLLKKQLDDVLPLFAAWGVKGLNIDFIESDDQEMVNFVHRCLRSAADYQLQVEFHGVYKPTGIRRTYPHFLSREAVLGLEYAKWDTLPTPEHDCILPFTRMLAGPLDYIPVGFSNATRNNFQIISDKFMTRGTRCHELAHLVIFENGFQVLADFPDNYRKKLGAEFFRHVPAAWDETRVLAGEVGDYIVIVRRKSHQWFLGANSDWTPRAITVSLDFLSDGAWHAQIYQDGPDAGNDATDAVYIQKMVTARDSLKIIMASGGGQAIRFFQ